MCDGNFGKWISSVRGVFSSSMGIAIPAVKPGVEGRGICALLLKLRAWEPGGPHGELQADGEWIRPAAAPPLPAVWLGN